MSQELRDTITEQMRTRYPAVWAFRPSWIRAVDFSQIDEERGRSRDPADFLNLGLALATVVNADAPEPVRRAVHALLWGIDQFLTVFAKADGVRRVARPVFSSLDPSDFWSVVMIALYALGNRAAVLRFEAPIPGTTKTADILMNVDSRFVYVEVEAKATGALDRASGPGSGVAAVIDGAARDKVGRKFVGSTLAADEAVVALGWRPSALASEQMWKLSDKDLATSVDLASGANVRVDHHFFQLADFDGLVVPALVPVGISPTEAARRLVENVRRGRSTGR